MLNNRLLQLGLMSAVLLSMPLAYAQQVQKQELAPVVDISQNQVGGEAIVPAPSGTNTVNGAAPTASIAVDSNAAQPAATSSAANQNSSQASNNQANPGVIQPALSAAQSTSLTTDQRVARLNQQMANLTRMNMPQQIADLQQQMQQIQGQLQVQAHDLKLLNNQQRSFYKDLDQRITQLKNLTSGSDSGTASDASSSSKASAATDTSSIQLKDSHVYEAAFKLLTKKQYDKAKSAFKNYLNDYPNGQFLANAHYWLGEIALLQKNYKQSIRQFNTVINAYPKSAKIADAKLKVAMVHVQQGKVSQARAEFIRIKKKHPGSTAAQLASIQLQQLNIKK